MMKLTHNSALQERPERINAGSVNLAAHVFALSVSYGFVVVIFVQQPIAAVFVGRDQRNVIRNGRAHKTVKGLSVGILDHLRDNHALASDSADHGNLASSTALIKPLVFVFVFLSAANEGFVNFDFASKRCDKITLHGRTPAHAHIPASVVVGAGIFAKNDAVNLQCADALLADQHQIANLKPKFQRLFGVLKNCMGEHGKTIAVSSAAIFILAEPMKRSSRKRIDVGIAATRASRAIRPAHFGQELAARKFVGELSVEGIDCFHTTNVTHDGLGVNTHLIAFAKGKRGGFVSGAS